MSICLFTFLSLCLLACLTEKLPVGQKTNVFGLKVYYYVDPKMIYQFYLRFKFFNFTKVLLECDTVGAFAPLSLPSNQPQVWQTFRIVVMWTVDTIATHTCPRVGLTKVFVPAKVCICRQTPRETLIPTLTVI